MCMDVLKRMNPLKYEALGKAKASGSWAGASEAKGVMRI
jgi:hypothetical protein